MSGEGLPVRRRRAVRVLLLDPANRVLLLRGRDPADLGGASWWFTPGGGVESGEDARAALRRECWEELGAELGPVHGPIARRCHEFAFDGCWLVQDTEYFWAESAAFEPQPQQWSEVEQRFLLGWRWWPVPELRATADTIYPVDLVDLVAAAGRGGR